MNKISFDIANSWKDHQDYFHFVASKDISGIYDITVSLGNYKGTELFARTNDFPDEPLYTLHSESEEIIHFDDWPSLRVSTLKKILTFTLRIFSLSEKCAN